MRFRSLVAAIAVAMPLTLVTATSLPATAADSNTFLMTGSGTFSPGLGVLPEAQSMSFGGTATVVGTAGIAATYSCSMSGSFTGSLAGGTGNVNGSCGVIPLTCAAVYVLGKWYYACVSATVVMDCTVTYTTISPTTSFDARCLGHHVHVE